MVCSTSPPGFGLPLGRGFAWLDTGTHDSLMDAGEFVRSIQHRQGLLIGCPEEIAWQKKFIPLDQLNALASKYGKSPYGQFFRQHEQWVGVGLFLDF